MSDNAQPAAFMPLTIDGKAYQIPLYSPRPGFMPSDIHIPESTTVPDDRDPRDGEIERLREEVAMLQAIVDEPDDGDSYQEN